MDDTAATLRRANDGCDAADARAASGYPYLASCYYLSAADAYDAAGIPGLARACRAAAARMDRKVLADAIRRDRRAFGSAAARWGYRGYRASLAAASQGGV